MIKKIKTPAKETTGNELIAKINEIIDLLCEKFPEECEPLPCPFCGAEPAVSERDRGAFVSCENSACPMRPRTDICATKARAIEKWNTRADK